MNLLRNEFSRFFALGFLGGAALVAATTSVGDINGLMNGIVPQAEAAASQE